MCNIMYKMICCSVLLCPLLKNHCLFSKSDLSDWNGRRSSCFEVVGLFLFCPLRTAASGFYQIFLKNVIQHQVTRYLGCNQRFFLWTLKQRKEVNPYDPSVLSVITPFGVFLAEKWLKLLIGNHDIWQLMFHQVIYYFFSSMVKWFVYLCVYTVFDKASFFSLTFFHHSCQSLHWWHMVCGNTY